QQVGAVRGDVDDNLMIRYGHHVQEPAPRRCGGVELEDAGVVFAETELFGGAEHAVRLDAADLAALELHAARQRGAHRCVGVGLARLHVGSAADDFDGPAACLDEAHRQPVRTGMLLHLEHTPDQDVAQVLVQRHDGVHRRDVHSELLGDLARVERAAQQRFEPAARDDHRTPPANCARKRTSLSWSSRMSAMPWRVMAMRAGPMPQANPEYRSLETPQFSSTAGCTMPEPRISIQPVCLQVAHPAPLQIWHCTSISADGSVNGKNDGRNRTRVSAVKKRRAKVARVALKSTKLSPSSTARPSICSNTGEWDASNGSRRYTWPGMTTRMGGG